MQQNILVALLFIYMSSKRDTVIFDCERMRYKNTGLYVFGKELIEALCTEAKKRERNIMVYSRKSTLDEWGLKIRFRRVFKSLHKRILPLPSDVGLWHSPFQLSHFFPRKTPILLTIHDLNFMYEEGESQQKKELKKLQTIIDKCARIVTISEFVKKDVLKHLNTNGKEIDVIYNGCTRFTGTPQIPADKPAGKFLFSVGTVLPKKNFHVLPCLLEGNDYELIIAGVRSEYEQKILKEAEFYGVTDRVKIIGTISEAEKHWYYKNCEAFLFPSVAEGFGLPVIEAMYYERPVFLSTHTCLPEIGGKYAFYFNYDFDRKKMQQEFRKGMQDFADTSIYREEMRNHALSFSWQMAAKKYWDIYEEMLKHNIDR